MIRHNAVIRSTDYGILVHGNGNLIADNPGYGLYFAASSTDSVYGGNIARPNCTDFEDNGPKNTSHGDNYMPGQM